MDIQALGQSLGAAKKYASARSATEPKMDPAADVGPGQSASAYLTGLTRDFAATLQETEDTAKAAMTTGADPHTLVQALAQTELAVEAAVTVRDRVVEAYQEILRMPV